MKEIRKKHTFEKVIAVVLTLVLITNFWMTPVMAEEDTAESAETVTTVTENVSEEGEASGVVSNNVDAAIDEAVDEVDSGVVVDPTDEPVETVKTDSEPSVADNASDKSSDNDSNTVTEKSDDLNSKDKNDSKEKVILVSDSKEEEKLRVQRATEDEATFKLEFPGLGAANANRVTYWDTWDEVVAKANEVHNDNANNKITVLRDCDVYTTDYFDEVNFRMTIDGNGHTISLKGNWSSDFIIWKKESSNNVLTINNLTIDGTGATGTAGMVSNTTQSSARTSSITINGCEFIRGGLTGTLIDAGTKAITLTNCTVDGSNTSVNSSLIKTSAANNTNAMTLSGVTIKNHKASGTGVYAVDATSVTGNNGVKISGNMTVTGNTAAGKPANLAVSGTNKLQVTAAGVSGTIGVSNINNYTAESTFGAKAGANALAGAFFKNDLSDTPLYGRVSGNNLVWTDPSTFDFDPHVTNAEVKITDADGNILLTPSYKYVVYSSFGDTVNGVKGPFFRYVEGMGFESYSGPINVETLVDTITRNSTYSLTTANQNITFKSASKSDDIYPYTGSNDKTRISFTNAGDRFVFQGGGSVYSFENIIIDGNNIEAQEGGLIKVGNRGAGAEYHATVVLKSGAVLQNGRTNNHDQGGGIYVGKGCKLYMEPGSKIKNCHAAHGEVDDATGGAIYLAEGEFYCNGGIIEDCSSVGGGVVDLGGATDGVGSADARIYLSGAPMIIDNTNSTSHMSMNVHLNYDSNEVIQVVGNLTGDAKIGVSVNTNPSIFNNHGLEGTPFATIASGVTVNPRSFVNDRDTKLTAMISTTNPNLLVWYYPLIVDAVDDYYIDGTKVRTTTLASEQYFLRDNEQTFTVNDLSDEFLSVHDIDLNKISNFDYIEALANTGVDGVVHPAIPSGITNIRIVDYGSNGGRRWEYSTDNGTSYNALEGRQIVIHYKRECRDNIKVVKYEDTNSNELLENVSFRLERSYPTSDSYSLYNSYTTDSSGEFIMNLPEGYYRLIETQAPGGYADLTSSITFHVVVNTVPDTTANTEVSPYVVEDVSNADYTGSTYSEWSTQNIIGTMMIGNVRKVPVHILLKKADGTYELKDDTTCVADYTSYVTAGLAEGLKSVTGINTQRSGYERLHIYYGKEDPGSFSGYDLEETEVESLKGTTAGILVNEETDKVLTKDLSLYYIFDTAFIARVSNDGGETWTDHEWLVNPSNQTGTTVKEGAFDQANTLTGDVIIETLKETHERYTLTSTATLSNNNVTSFTLRTTTDSEWNPDGFKSVLVRGWDSGDSRMISVSRTFTVDNMIFKGKDGDTQHIGRAIDASGGNGIILTIRNSEFLNFSNTSGGGAIITTAETLVENSTFRDCKTTNSGNCNGGGAINTDKAITIRNNTSDEVGFYNCISNTSAGGVQAKYAPVTIENTSSGKIVFDTCGGNNDGGAVDINTGQPFTINNTGSGTISFIDCYSDAGGVVCAESAAISIINNGRIETINCSTNGAYSGGGLFAYNDIDIENNGTMLFDGCYTYDDKTTGGAIYTSGGNVSITGTGEVTFVDCHAKEGGGIYAGGSVTIKQTGGVTFANCDANSGPGGGIYAKKGVTISKTGNGAVTFTNCTATADGGAIYATGSSTSHASTIEGAVFTDCRSTVTSGNGGSIYVSSNANATIHVISDCTFFGHNSLDDNTVNAKNGGGLAIGTSANVTGCTFVDCTAATNGGAISMAGGTGDSWEIVDCVILGHNTLDDSINNAAKGGAIYVDASLGTKIKDLAISECYASGDGGGIYINSGTTSTEGIVFIEECKSAGNGGGAYFNAVADIDGKVTFDTCDAITSGGGAYFAKTADLDGTISFEGCYCTIANGGGLYAAAAVTSTSGTISFEDCYTLAGRGGGAYFNAAATLNNADFTDCHTDSTNSGNGGGAFFNATSAMNGTVSFDSCYAGTNGGGAYLKGASTVNGTLSFDDCYCANNGNGGGIYAENTVTSTTGTISFEDCYCNGRGGGAYFGNTVNLANADFTNCHADSTNSGYGGGGAWFNVATTLNGNISFDNCYAGSNGGGMYAYAGFTNSSGTISFTDCHADAHGGGAFFNNTATLTGTGFEDCYAGGYGGGMYLNNGGTLTNVTVNGHTSGGLASTTDNAVLGGAFYLAKSTVTVIGGEYTNCSASDDIGGAVNVGTANSVLNFEDNAIVYDNISTDGSGDEQQRNVVLDRDSNTVIKTTSNGLGSNAKIGVYVPDGSSLFDKHGDYAKPFGTYGVDGDYEHFYNDRLSDDTQDVVGVAKKATDSTNIMYWPNTDVKLTIKETTTGAIGDLTKDFTFTIGGLPAGNYTCVKKNADGTTDDSVQTIAVTGTGSDATGTFTLKSDEEIEISIPANTVVSITEDKGYYTATFTAVKTIDMTTPVTLTNLPTGATGNAVNGARLTVAEDTTMMVVNDLGDIAPTGVDFTYLAFILIFLAGASLGTTSLLMMRRRRVRR